MNQHPYAIPASRRVVFYTSALAPGFYFLWLSSITPCTQTFSLFSHQLKDIYLFLIFLFETVTQREEETEKSMCLSIPQMVTMARDESKPGASTFCRSLMWCQDLRPQAVLCCFLGHKLGARSEWISRDSTSHYRWRISLHMMLVPNLFSPLEIFYVVPFAYLIIFIY